MIYYILIHFMSKKIKLIISYKYKIVKEKTKINGDWGLGIGDWAQSPIPKSPIPNPQSPILLLCFYLK